MLGYSIVVKKKTQIASNYLGQSNAILQILNKVIELNLSLLE